MPALSLPHEGWSNAQLCQVAVVLTAAAQSQVARAGTTFSRVTPGGEGGEEGGGREREREGGRE